MEPIETKTIELDGDSFENPIFCSHRRGRNWVAKLTGKNAANMSKSFLKSRGETVDVESVGIADVLEIAGDYTTSGGRFDPNRIYWRVVEKTDDEMTVEVHASAAKALKSARLAARAAAESAVESIAA
ncbi:hypothetical protein [Mesorhizobium sp. ES1-4]|uniref:hypothetical protein n=1 Tax=Mesorhizobium sp. ES1-4 TaxID=2876627 RepID=UPI001CCD298B|nr:hypothetical protein [Mesorhizobium sp. ES1-4]MBZ9798733.1 hypothetical protein [Mesorhizobium sp. ES1-4]